MEYRNVVWDWNGTLLNDLETGVQTLNDMFARRGMPAFSVEEYRERFGFPVIDFYRDAGLIWSGRVCMPIQWILWRIMSVLRVCSV